jgi:hypothetical protein
LALLDRATAFREAHEGIIYTLPLAGLAIGAIYERYGTSILPGNNLVIDVLFATGRERGAPGRNRKRSRCASRRWSSSRRC